MIRVIVDRGRSLRSATGLASGSGGRVACLPSLSAALYSFAADIAPGGTRHALPVTCVTGRYAHFLPDWGLAGAGWYGTTWVGPGL
jgi:hypothetical protein